MGAKLAHRPSMSLLDGLIPEPDLVELDSVDISAPPERAWPLLRHADLGRSTLVRALFRLRTVPARLTGHEPERLNLTIDDILKDEKPGFRVLGECPNQELAVGAIGKVWHLDIPFEDVRTAEAFESFDRPGFAKVAWALRISPLGDHGSRIEFELRVLATDAESRRSFRRYFTVIGPASHFIRRHLLALLARDLGTPEAEENERSLPGDDLLPDAQAQVTHGITIHATPQAIWPWLVQMGCHRAGWYSVDSLDNGGEPSAREIHPELQQTAVGDVLPATPDSKDGFEVLRIDPNRALVLGGLYDAERGNQIRFADARPKSHWHVTWAFVLEPLNAHTTRLHARGRVAFSRDERLHALWIRPVHHFMQGAQLLNLARRAEGTLSMDGLRDVREGVIGASGILLDLVTPFLAGVRSHWGVDKVTATRELPGDDLIPNPRWSWTHGIEIAAPPEEVWPWIAQIGADKGGFYSYQWLENMAGCGVQNAEITRREWEVRPGDSISLHPRMPRLPVVAVEPGRFFVVHGAPDAAAQREGRSWTSASWLFHVEPLPNGNTRFISRFRSSCSSDLLTRFQFGPYVTESVGFVMDRRMLLGVKERVERRRAEVLATAPHRAM
jgi:hypothetical protein